MKNKIFLFLLTCISLASCGSQPKYSEHKNGIYGLQYASNRTWVKKLHSLNQGKNIKFRIVQIGDSHTAGDYFSGELRSRLQAAFGNGGIGLVSPTNVSGQRNAQIKYQNTGWQTFTSRKDQGDFPLGGILAQSNAQSVVTLNPINNTQGEQKITFYLKPSHYNDSLLIQDSRGHSQSIKANSTQWQHLSIQTSLPLSYRAQNGQWSVGQIQIENNHHGVIVSALGINGAQLSHTKRWRTNWINELKQTEADLIILAFGTNEATNERLDIQETENTWLQTIRQIRKILPNAGILIIGAPESLQKTTGKCGQRLIMLDQVQKMQKKIAQKAQVAYWSWQDAMGGECHMKPWINNGLARPDGVHFSANGYQQAANKLANALIKIAK